MEKKSKYRTIQRIVFIGIGILILVGLILNVGPGNVRDHLLEADITYLILAFVLFVSVMMIKIIRWAILFPELKFFDAGKVFSIGQIVNETAPIGSGELTRGFVAKSKFNVSFSKTLAPALIERISDVTFLFALTLMFILLILTDGSYYYIVIFVVLLLSVLYFFLFRPKYIEKISIKLFKPAGDTDDSKKTLKNNIQNFLNSFQEALLKFHKRKGVLGTTIGLTVFAWTVEVFGQWTLIQAFGIGYDLNFFILMATIGATWVIGTFSFLPGGIGVREFVFTTFLFQVFAISTATGGSIAIVYRLLNYLLLAGFALISFIKLPANKK